MLSYELAKALQDAGFPQNGSGTRIAPPEMLVARRHDFAYVPTLDELIEACGNVPFTLERPKENGTWEASTEEDGIWWYEEGDTPTEAIARLWLALNKQ